MSDKYFDEKDLDLLIEGLRLVPELEIAIYFTKLAREVLQFPLKSHEDIKPLFSQFGDEITFKVQKINYNQVVKFLPKFCFPISDKDELLGKIIIGFTKAAAHHRKRKFANLMRDKGQKGLNVIFPPGYSNEIFQ